ncbi:transducin beta-like protein 2 isoform X3 [Leptopilina boulardi]|uniref:transducin beta-like protein 2 isoform X3 n=1 Tax=Leptopilina boulardi TaxID=63433 RepID=UPI0021F5D05B|nr:transducin beta-like protein 2 isoform X3 [Leptopilina boulardi]
MNVVEPENVFGLRPPVLMVILGSLVLGGLFFAIGHIVIKLGRRNKKEDATKNSANKDIQKSTEEQDSTISESGPGTNNTMTNSKRARKKRREAQQEFNHSWMVGALKGHTAPVRDINFSSNGKFLASCAEDRTVLLWCTKDLSAKDKRSLRVNIEYDHATLIRWSPDGKAFLIHKALGNAIEVYKISKKSDGTLASATKSFEFPKHHVEDVVGMDIACNGRYIVTCSTVNDLVIWDLKGQILANVDTYLGTTHKARISPCGRFVAASGFTPDVKVWEVGFTKSGEFKQVSKAFNLAGHSSGVYDFGFSADTSYMATVSKDGTYRFYDTKIEFEKGEDPRILVNGSWESASTANLALSPNGEVLAIAHGSSLSFYCTVTGAFDTTIDDIFNGPITCLAFDAAGEYLLVAGDRHIKIFRNIPGYRATIESSKKKLEQRQTSATRERLEKTILDCKQFLAKMDEKYPQ